MRHHFSNGKDDYRIIAIWTMSEAHISAQCAVLIGIAPNQSCKVLRKELSVGVGRQIDKHMSVVVGAR